MSYKDPVKRSASNAAASKKWREEFRARDPEGYREYMRAARVKWAANMTDDRKAKLREYQAEYRRKHRPPRAERPPRPERIPHTPKLSPEEFTRTADDPRHGTPNGYNNLGCRCKRCTKAHTEYQRAYWERRRARERSS